MAPPATIAAAPSRPQRNAGPAAAPLSTIKLASRLLELARRAESAGRPQVAGFLVGAALRQVRRPPSARSTAAQGGFGAAAPV